MARTKRMMPAGTFPVKSMATYSPPNAFTQVPSASIGYKTRDNYMSAGEVRAALADLHDSDLTNIHSHRRPVQGEDLLRVYFVT